MLKLGSTENCSSGQIKPLKNAFLRLKRNNSQVDERFTSTRFNKSNKGGKKSLLCL